MSAFGWNASYHLSSLRITLARWIDWLFGSATNWLQSIPCLYSFALFGTRAGGCRQKIKEAVATLSFN